MKMRSSNTIRFTKMHGLGNDFVIINALDQALTLPSLPIKQLADRHRGIGFDQLLIIESSQQADFFCRIFNADGSEAEQCGNGLRCIARFIHETGLHAQTMLRIETKAGIFPIFIQDYDHIRVTLEAPHIQEKLIALPLKEYQPAIPLSILSTGNPHAIVKMESLDQGLVNQLAPEIATHTLFPQGVNVGFMQVLDRHHVRLRTFERGVGETYACGSNACAAACAGIANHWLQHEVTVEFRFGSLLVEWQGEHHPIHLTGPAAHVYSGEIAII